MFAGVGYSQTNLQRAIRRMALLFLIIFIGYVVSGCKPKLISDVERQPFQPEYFTSILWAPGTVTDIGQTCIDSDCYMADTARYLMVIGGGVDTPCIGVSDWIVTLYALAHVEGNIEYMDRLPLRGTTVAVARIADPIAHQNGIVPGVFVVDTSGRLLDLNAYDFEQHIYVGLLLFARAILESGPEGLSSNNGEFPLGYQHIMLDTDCNEHMKLWPEVRILGDLEADAITASPIGTEDYQRQIYAPDYFDTAILWAPGVTDLGEVCSNDYTNPRNGTFNPGFCYPVDRVNYVMVVIESSSDNAVTCAGWSDRIVTLWAIPDGALDDGVVTLDDFERYGPELGNIQYAGATAAIARIPPEIAAQHPARGVLLPNEGRGNMFFPGVFLVNVEGHPALGSVDDFTKESLMQFSIGLLEGNGTNTSEAFRFVPLERVCKEQMELAQDLDITGWLYCRRGGNIPCASGNPIDPTLTPQAIIPTATPESGTATLSGVVFPAGTDGGTCGEVTVYAIDIEYPGYGGWGWGQQWYSTTINDWPCRYTLEVPAPGTYLLSAIQPDGTCGAHMPDEIMSELTMGYCPGDCEPEAVSVQPGDVIEELHIPLFIPPGWGPRNAPNCPWAPESESSSETAPIQIELANLHCYALDYYVDGQWVATVDAGSVAYFQASPGEHSSQICSAGTDNCGDSGTVYWPESLRQEIPRGFQCGEFNGPLQFHAESINGCSVTFNGYIKDVQGPWSWDFGDGTYSTGWFPQTHTYLANGTYYVNVFTPGGVYSNTAIVNLSSCQ